MITLGFRRSVFDDIGFFNGTTKADLCSIPERIERLRQTLNSLASQVDALHLYLDRYAEIPDFVRSCHERITVYQSRDYPGLRDNGKFLPFVHLEPACYYFTADDDLLYPPDYVNTMIRKIEEYGRQAVIGVHGVVLADRPTGYFSAFRKVYLFKKALERDALVNNLGTGTVAFHSSRLAGLDYRQFAPSGMVDLFLAVFCKQRQIPMIAIARHDHWLLEMESTATSLFEQFHQADEKQAQLVRTHWPWGYTAIQSAVDAVTEHGASTEVVQRLHQLMPTLRACLW